MLARLGEEAEERGEEEEQVGEGGEMIDETFTAFKEQEAISHIVQ